MVYLFLFLILLSFGCKEQSPTDKYIDKRNNIENVHSKVVEIPMEEVLISGFSNAYLLDNYLIIKDNRSPNKLIHLFDKKTFKHVISSTEIGQGPKEITNLLEGNLSPLNSAILELLYAAGLRVSELTDILLQNIDLNAKYIRCTGKGSKERIIPIGNKACISIKKYLKEREYIIKKYNISSKYCFLKENGKKISRQDVYLFIIRIKNVFLL